MITVCIPTFNGAEHVAACLESALGQTFRKLEILVVDDCSTDETLDVVRRVARGDSRVRIVQNSQNLGLAGNWNRCVELSAGEWIKFLFQDDLLDPHCVERMLDAAVNGYPLIACRRGFIFAEGTSEETRAHYFRDQTRIDNLYAEKPWLTPHEYADAVLDQFGWNLLGEPTAVLLNRSVFSQFGMFNSDLVQACDLEYWNRVGIHTGVRFVRETLASFRVHCRSATARNKTIRKFRRSVVDGLLLRHMEARDEAYAPLREAAARRDPAINLEARLRDTSISALDRAKGYRKVGRDHEDPRRVLKGLSPRYKGIQPPRIEYMVWRLRRVLRLAKETLARRLPARGPRPLDG